MKKFTYILITISLCLFMNISVQAQTSFNISNKTTGDTLLSIDNDGKVGIGTTSPGASVDVKSAAVENGSSLNLGNFDDSHWLYLYSGRSGASALSPVMIWNEGDPMRFASWGAQYNEYMRISGNGFLGLGTQNPGAKLHIAGDGFPNSFIFLEAETGGDAGIRLFEGSSPEWHIYNSPSAGGLQIQNNAFQTVFFADQSTGNVGIGTTSPSSQLEVAGTIRSISGGFMFPDNTVQVTAATGGGASSIDDLTDGKTGGNSVFLGAGAGANDDASDNRNTAMGIDALNSNITGNHNTTNGFNAQYWNDVGNDNVSIGYQSDFYNQGGSQNTIIGYQAGAAGSPGLHNKSGNVFLGYQAGFSEIGDNKLYIENSNSNTPLIGGDFSIDEIYLNGNVGIGTSAPLTKLHVKNVDISLQSADLPNELITVENSDAGLGLYSSDNGNYGSVFSMGEIVSGSLSNKWSIYRTTSAANPGSQLRFSFGESSEYWINPTYLALSNNGNIGIGTTNPSSKLTVIGTVECDVLEIKGGSDIAEPFDINHTKGIETGMVLAIDSDNPGKLKISKKAYDRRVAGIISGAGGINPGMIMGQSGSVADGEFPVALTGRVYCWADASNGSINPGDLLTTSDIPGHAMKVFDYKKAQGAVIGKAMSPLDEGRGLILVLVSLQ